MKIIIIGFSIVLSLFIFNAACFAMPGDKEDIGFLLKADLHNVCSRFGYDCTVSDGYKVEGKDGYVYYFRCTNVKLMYGWSDLKYGTWKIIEEK
jgi:hypothetical protein